VIEVVVKAVLEGIFEIVDIVITYFGTTKAANLLVRLIKGCVLMVSGLSFAKNKFNESHNQLEA
jgi:hypothetical protein